MVRLKRGDWRFVALVLAHAIGIAGFLLAGAGEPALAGSGYRRIDTEAVRARIRAGDLVDREADWYRPLEAGEAIGPGQPAEPPDGGAR